MITTTIDGPPVKASPTFPAIYKSGNVVILATKLDKNRRELTGTVISDSSVFPLGQHSTSWNSEEFTRWDGTVTLKNSD